MANLLVVTVCSWRRTEISYLELELKENEHFWGREASTKGVSVTLDADQGGSSSKNRPHFESLLYCIASFKISRFFFFGVYFERLSARELFLISNCYVFSWWWSGRSGYRYLLRSTSAVSYSVQTHSFAEWWALTSCPMSSVVNFIFALFSRMFFVSIEIRVAASIHFYFVLFRLLFFYCKEPPLRPSAMQAMVCPIWTSIRPTLEQSLKNGAPKMLLIITPAQDWQEGKRAKRALFAQLRCSDLCSENKRKNGRLLYSRGCSSVSLTELHFNLVVKQFGSPYHFSCAVDIWWRIYIPHGWACMKTEL